MAIRISDRNEVKWKQKKKIKTIFEIPSYKNVSKLVWLIIMMKFEANSYLTSH